MKRWNIDGMKLYYPSMHDAIEAWPEAKTISEIRDNNHLKYIEDILNRCQVVTEGICGNDRRTILHYNSPFGLCEIILSKDESDGHYYDYAKCRLHRNGRLTAAVLWDVTTPKEVCCRYFVSPAEYSVLSIGDKVAKPSELKGVKPDASVCFTKASCQLYIRGWDLYIKHTDYFSPVYERPEDIGTPLLYRAAKYGIDLKKKGRFIYTDDWGSIVLRQNAWCKFSNFIPVLCNHTDVECGKIMSDMLREYHSLSYLDNEWLRFFEQVAKKLR